MHHVMPSPLTGRRRPAAPSVVVLLLALLLGLPGTAAHAEAPLRDLEGDVTDVAGVLDDAGLEQVQASLDELAEQTSYQLFVVYVERFDGTDGRAWADQTANNARLGPDDLLLAVATEDRLYGMSVDQNVALDDDQLDVVRDAAVDELRDDDWAGATVAAVDAVLAQTTVDEPDTSGLPLGWLVAAGGLVLVVVVVLVVRSRRRDRDLTSRGAEAARSRSGRQVDPLAGLDLDELRRRTGSALVAVDDAVRSSAQELAFAEAEFGVDATRDFAAVLDTAREQVAAAFALRGSVTDVPGGVDPAHEHAVLRDVVGRCAAASAALEAQARAFDDLRALQSRAPQVLDEAAARSDELEARIEVARSVLSGLTRTYPATALASVTGNPDQAATLIAGARAAVEAGRAALGRRTKGVAVAEARAAQAALDQAGSLLDAVDSADRDLAHAATSLDKAVASVTQDLVDADRLAPDEPVVRAAAAEARQAAAQAQDARDGGDPLAALSRLATAEAALDATLAPLRQQAESDARARALVRDVLGRIDVRLRTTQDFVTTRRGAVGAEARGLLAEATRLAGEAAGQTDPHAALGTAQQAERVADAAAAAAHADAEAWSARQAGPSRSHGTRSPGLGGMVLGGILLDSVLSGGGRGRRPSAPRGYGGARGMGASRGRARGGRGGGAGRGRRSSGGRF
jgi:hypothetical protein